jgi:hypothetical protein
MYLLVNAVCCYVLWKVWGRLPKLRRLIASVVAVVGVLSVPEMLGASSLIRATVEFGFVVAGCVAVWWLLHHRGYRPAQRVPQPSPSGWKEVTVIGGHISRVATTWNYAGPHEPPSGTLVVAIRFDVALIVTLNSDGVEEDMVEGGEMLFPVCGDNSVEVSLAHGILTVAADAHEPVDATWRYAFDGHEASLSSGSLRTQRLEVNVGHLDMP